MTDPSSVLKLTGPFSVTVSTAGNPSVVALQFNLANVGFSPVKLRRGTLLVPVSTSGVNITSGLMTPVADTAGWTFAPETVTPKPGYAAFALIASDGVGTIPLRGSVTFALSNVTVAQVTGTATLPFAAETSLGKWPTQIDIDLNPPSTVPEIQDAGLLPLMILQNQETVLHWTATGTAYCEVTDDQNSVLGTNLPAGGALAVLSDTPVQHHSPTETAPNGADYYTRGYTLTAHSAGVDAPDERLLSVQVGLPTIVSFTIAPATLVVGQPVVVSWSVANLDGESGRITLAVAPQDGTASQQIAISLGTPDDNGLFAGTAALTPTPLATTEYTLTIESGHGLSAMQAQTVTSPLSPGLNLISNTPDAGNFLTPVMASFDDKLWWVGFELSWTRNGTEWTQGSLPTFQIRALLAADLGDGEVLCALGIDPLSSPAAAWTRDGVSWQPMAPPVLTFSQGQTFFQNGTPVATPLGVVVCGGWAGGPNNSEVPLSQVWLSRTGAEWTQVSNTFPLASAPELGPFAVAWFEDKIYTVPLNDDSGPATAWSSADGGATWQAQSNPLPLNVAYWSCTLQAAGDQLWLLGAGSSGNALGEGDWSLGRTVLALEKEGSWKSLNWMLPWTGENAWYPFAQVAGYLWFGAAVSNEPQLYLLNQVLPGTVFKLTPVKKSEAAVAVADAPAGRP